jgi:hypothetical protein
VRNFWPACVFSERSPHNNNNSCGTRLRVPETPPWHLTQSGGVLVLAKNTPLGSSSSARNTIETVFAFDKTIFRLPLLNPLSKPVTNGQRVAEKE